MRKILASALAGFGLVIVATPSALAWDKIGVRVVSDRAERDVINVKGRRRYERIKICVYRHPVRFYDVNVNFRNGGRQDIAMRSRIEPRQCTRAIDLKGGDRDITTIVLIYEETSRRRARAKVRIFAE